MEKLAWLSELVSQIPTLILAAGGGSALTWLIARKVSVSWLDGRFAKNFETYKHKQTVELHRLRLEIDSLLSGAIKLQEREFEILPEIWSRFEEATRQCRSLISPFRPAVDYSLESDEGIVEILSARKIPQHRVLEILELSPAHRHRAIRQLDFENELLTARRAYLQLQDTASRFAIFVPPKLQALLEVSIFELGLILGTKEINRGTAGEFTLSMDMFQEKIVPLQKDVQAEIAMRLRGHGVREDVGTDT
ncbi:hypothetical protein [Achromobacter kerstersii]|uniref:hypothetical protein n=1 Tax=Achromobacter kerstersii TaxID=1353890 RepID=UPI003D03B254